MRIANLALLAALALTACDQEPVFVDPGYLPEKPGRDHGEAWSRRSAPARYRATDVLGAGGFCAGQRNLIIEIGDDAPDHAPRNGRLEA